MGAVQFRLCAQTHVGCVRTNNEDNVIVNPDLSKDEWGLPSDSTLHTLGLKGALLVVADGMGGLEAGEIASQIAIDTIKAFFSPGNITDETVKDDASIRQYMGKAIAAADANIRKAAGEESAIGSMGTTIVVTWLFNNFAYTMWCGDSRLYMFSALSGLEQKSRDHSYVQDLVNKGELAAELAFDHPDSNIITRSLGHPVQAAMPDFVKNELCCDSLLLLCSDGLNSMLKDDEIEAIIRQNPDSTDSCACNLTAEALDKGGYDNVTLILCRIVRKEDDASSEPLSATVYEAKARASKRRAWMIAGLIIIILLAALIFIVSFCR
ncbi:MAG: protein phosphatase 2C domain-containing protein [Tannerellaceae bacterium]|jgi:protein phosphatase|nr:protein phosphatase 2C domain-containing protein [Tannerellaceae bacterium]